MNYTSDSPYIQELYEYAAKCGIPEKCLFCKENQEQYIETAVDGYSEYALFQHLFRGNYDTGVFTRMMSVDFRSRLGIMAGLADSENYASILLIEPPHARKTGMGDYVKIARPGDFSLLFHGVVYRLEEFEKFALAKRSPYMDDYTWYLYIFATRQADQGKGHGGKLLKVLRSFADEKGYRICLETNDPDNVGLYEHFGYQLVDQSRYQDVLEHFDMVYESKERQQ